MSSLRPAVNFALVLSYCVVALMGASAFAQQNASEACSSAATVFPNSKQLPPPPTPFGGVIKEQAKDSKPCWDPRIVPPKGAPNVLLIMTDDVGFGAPSTFGGVIPTPALERIAQMGLRYTNFHSTALCSPTRAALITGRNHHTAGFGVISEMATGFPGYNAVIERTNGTVGEILRQNGYSTSMIISLFDAKAKELIWRGIAQDTLSNNGNKNQQMVQKAINKMFKQWPKS